MVLSHCYSWHIPTHPLACHSQEGALRLSGSLSVFHKGTQCALRASINKVLVVSNQCKQIGYAVQVKASIKWTPFAVQPDRVTSAPDRKVLVSNLEPLKFQCFYLQMFHGERLALQVDNSGYTWRPRVPGKYVSEIDIQARW